MRNLELYLTLGILAALLLVVVIGWLSSRAGRRHLTRPRPGQTSGSLPADPEPAPLAAPFAQQIEEMIRAELASDPELASYDVDFGTSPDGSLAITVDGQTYLEIKSIPEEPIRSAIARAIAGLNRSP